MARYQHIAIGALERGVRTLAKSLEKLGLTTQVHVFKSGPGGATYFGASYVELEVSVTFNTPEGEQDASHTVKFLANGYTSNDADEIGGTQGWRPMGEEARTRILTKLQEQGWKLP